MKERSTGSSDYLVPVDRYFVDSDCGFSETVPFLISRRSSCRMPMFLTKKRHTSSICAGQIGFRDLHDWIELNFFWRYLGGQP